jgi:GNAT superfamily N-acetyltransferase
MTGLLDPAHRLAAGGLSLALEARPPDADILTLERGLFAFEEARLGSPEHVHFSIFLRDGDGRTQGGVDVHIMWRRLFIKTLWLAEAFRGQGFGTALMHELEHEAVRRRCRSLWLTALGDPARGFYLRWGYTVVGVLNDYVGGQGLFTMEKRLPGG